MERQRIRRENKRDLVFKGKLIAEADFYDLYRTNVVSPAFVLVQTRRAGEIATGIGLFQSLEEIADFFIKREGENTDGGVTALNETAKLFIEEDNETIPNDIKKLLRRAGLKLYKNLF